MSRDVSDVKSSEMDENDYDEISNLSYPRCETYRKSLIMVHFNIGGKHFQIQRATLNQIADTKLSNLTEADSSYDALRKHYYFDRNPYLFPFILDAYRAGRIHFPHGACWQFIEEELAYWGLGEECIAECCWRRVKCMEHKSTTLAQIERNLKYNPSEHLSSSETLTRRQRWKQAVWALLEKPTSSLPAKIWAGIFACFVVINVVLDCVVTLPYFRVPTTAPLNTSGVTNPKVLLFLTSNPVPAIHYIMEALTAIFLLELLLRFATCPNKQTFFKSPYAIIDVLAILPQIIAPILDFTTKETSDTLVQAHYTVAFLGVFRILRLIKLTQHHTGMKIVLHALSSSRREITLLVMLLAVSILIFATLIFYAELYVDDGVFLNIPLGCWWAVVTMTTLGYGDFYPASYIGYIVGGICAFAGLIATGLSIPIITNNFTSCYSFIQGTCHYNVKQMSELDNKRSVLAASTRGHADTTHATSTVKKHSNHRPRRAIRREDANPVSRNNTPDVTTTIPEFLPGWSDRSEGDSGRKRPNTRPLTGDSHETDPRGRCYESRERSNGFYGQRRKRHTGIMSIHSNTNIIIRDSLHIDEPTPFHTWM